ncbi:MAG TPA: carboxypeptidase-like regulatory domain-containing protein, partial [Bacteroidia bacterium]|nr:carboxypeptidase-like regulatory domain-containing protein [Bacteroidia bacterium]
MNRNSFVAILILSVFLVSELHAQTLTQTVRGTVVDQVSQSPLPGANVIVVNSNPFLGAATDLDGAFVLKNVPVGKQTLKISFLGYKEYILPNITVTTGKEVVLSVSLEENVVMGKE